MDWLKNLSNSSFWELLRHSWGRPKLPVLSLFGDGAAGHQPRSRLVVCAINLAQKILDGLPTIVELEAMDDEAIIQTLTQVKGIGRSLVQMLLIFRLNRQDVLPLDDLGVRAGIRRVYSLNELPDKQTILRLRQRWQPYCTVAS